MRGLRAYRPKSSNPNVNGDAKLVYYPLTRHKSLNRNQTHHTRSKSLEVQFQGNIQRISLGFDQSSCFFFKMNDTIDPDPNQLNTDEFANFNCSACNKCFFCKRLTDHQRECPIINKFNGSGDKIDTHLNISNNNILRHSVVCYLCGNRYSFRSIVYHEERCGKKFNKFCLKNEIPQKPEITDSLLLDIVHEQHHEGNHQFAPIDAFNDIMFRASLKNEELLKSRLKYF